MNSYTPPKHNTPTIIICALLFLCAAVAVCFSALGIGYRLILQLAAIGAIVAAIQLTSRYPLCEYTYRVEAPTDGDYPVFTVLKRQSGIVGGSDYRTVCSISMSTVTALVERKPVGELEAKYGRFTKGFNYTANLFPINDAKSQIQTKHYAYIFDFNGTNSVIYLECDKAYYEYLCKIITDITAPQTVYDPEQRS